MKTSELTFTAIVIALAAVLNYLSTIIPFFRLPQGGSVVVLSSFLIFLIGVKYGLKQGLIAGVIYGLFNYLINPYVLYPLQFFFDYIFAFAVYGLGALFLKFTGKYKYYKLFIAYFLCCLLRLAFSTASGMLFFAEYAEGQNVFIYSVTYNMMYILPEFALNVVLANIPQLSKVFKENFVESSTTTPVTNS